MNRARPMDSFGDFVATFHENQAVFIHYQFDLFRICDFASLSEIARAAFKLPIADIIVPIAGPSESLKFVVITEDENAHVIYLKGNKLKILVSTKIEDRVIQAHALLLDSDSQFNLLFDSGNCIRMVPKQEPDHFTTIWEKGEIVEIYRMNAIESFEEQSVRLNSASFLAYSRDENSNSISSWTLDFKRNMVIKGPFQIQLSSISQYLSPGFFLEDNSIYSIKSASEVCEIIDVYVSSNFSGNLCYFSTNSGEIYTVDSESLVQMVTLSYPPIRIETNGTDFIYLQSDGTLISPSTGATTKIPYYYRLEEYNSIFIRCGLQTVVPFPQGKLPPPKITSITYSNNIVSSSNGAEWEAPAEIVAFDTVKLNNEENIIVTTAVEVYILVFSSTTNEFEVFYHRTWDSPIITAAISQKLYAIASIDNRVQVSSYHDDSYTFTFQNTMCISLSLSEETLASGFCDGSFILASLKERGPLYSVKPFKTPIHSVRHVTPNATVVQWNESIAVVENSNIEWLQLPSFLYSISAAFAPGLLALCTPVSLEIYNFTKKKMLAKVPIRCIGVCCSGRRFFALTSKNELIALYYHRELTIDRQSLIDVEDPIAIAAVDETVYVICTKCIAVFDMRGHRLDTVELPVAPRFYDAAQRGFYIVFARRVCYISRDQSMKKIPHEKSSILGFTAIDDESFVIATSSRILVGVHKGEQVSFTSLTKITQKVSSMKAYSSHLDGNNDTLIIVYEDGEIIQLSLPTK